MDGDNTDIGCSFSNSQNSICVNSSDSITNNISSVTQISDDRVPNDVEIVSKCDSDENIAEDRLCEHFSKTERDDGFLKKKKMKFNYVKTRIIDKNSNSGDSKVVKSVYMTSCQSNGKWRKLSVANIEEQLKGVCKSTIEIKETNCGIIVLFYDDDDFMRMTKMNLSKVFDTPIAVWNIPHTAPKLNNVILIRDIPWCVKIKEIEDVLRSHNVQPLHSSRIEDGIIRVVVKNTYSLPRLVREGFNFYNCINLPVFIEPHSQLDIIQCYRCQRFWHTAQYCPFFERCVRCGDKHDLKKCTRARNNPNCCLCGDSHHAAYKFCPVRIQHLNAVQVEMNMERE